LGLVQRLDALPFKRKLLALALIGILFYGGLIAVDNVFGIARSVGPPVDVDFYRERASAIINGSVPYRDFPSESPPLIMYLFVIPQLAGGSAAAYQVFFSLFAIATSLSFYLLLRRFDESKAFHVGLLYLSLPYAFLEFTLGVQDEAITAFFFVLPLLIFVNRRYLQTAMTATMGFWVKFFNFLLMPIMFLKTPGRSIRGKEVLIVVVTSILVATPFLILAGTGFLDFPQYYFLDNPAAQTGGRGSISPWHFLDMGGYALPGSIGFLLTAGVLIFAWYYTWKKQLPFWASCAFTMFLFIIFYPKVNFVYFIMPISIFMIYGLEDRAILIRCFLLSVPSFASGAFTEYNPYPLINIPGGWMIGLGLSLVSYAVLLDIFMRTRGKKAFFEM
jgi:hypothetical protein